MPCAPYDNWLTDAVLGALSSRDEARLNRHLAGCSVCRNALERKRLLLGAIECGVAASVDAEPAPEMVARVRMRLAQENVSAAAPFSLWLPIAGAVLAAVALFALWLRPWISAPPQVATGISSLPAPRTMAPEPGSKAFPARVPSFPRAAHRPRQPATQEPLVLVPPGQWQGVLELADAVSRGRISGPALAANPENTSKPLALEAMSLAPLEIARLDEKDGERKLIEDNSQR